MTMIIGLEVREAFITPAWEAWLLKAIELSGWMTGSTIDRTRYPSLVARFGSYAYGNGIVSSSLPRWAQVIRAMHPPPPLDEFDHLTLNYYATGDGIAHHVDSEQCGDVIGVISLGGDASMEMQREGLLELVQVPARSLVVLSGEARWEWTHSILPVEKSRISIVLRRVGTLIPG